MRRHRSISPSSPTPPSPRSHRREEVDPIQAPLLHTPTHDLQSASSPRRLRPPAPPIPATPLTPLPRRTFATCLALWLLLALLDSLPLFAATLTARLDPDTTTPGEPATLALVFEGGQPDNVPSVPAQANLAVAYGGQSSQYSVVNGRVSSSVTHSYTLTASQPGTYTVPAVSATVAGRTVQSAPVTLRVNRPVPGDENALARYAFLRVTIPKNEVYQGEVFPVETRLYYISAQEIQMPQLQADGFTVGKPAQPAQGRVQISGNIYNVYVFKQTATAARTGELTLGPASCELVLRIPQRRNNRSNDPFDLFGFGESQSILRKATLQSDPIRIKVLPLPEANKPNDFNGAVGDFTFAASAGPNSLPVGDPITLTLKIAGTGAFDSVAMPQAIQGWRGFKSYPPNIKFEPSDPLGMEGTKTLEQVIVPEDASVREVPAIRFSFFDPGRKIYRTLEHQATPLTVRPSAQPAAQPTVLAATAPATASAPAAARDIAHIKTRPGSLQPVGLALLERPAFMALQLLPILAWLAAFAWRKSQQRIDSNPRLRRQLVAKAAVRRSLKQLQVRAQAHPDSPEQFHAAAFRLLQEALGGRLDLPASAITESVIDDHLRKLGAPPASLETLASLFQTFNHARYGGANAQADTSQTLAQIESILQVLDQLPEPGTQDGPDAVKPAQSNLLLLILLPGCIHLAAHAAIAAPATPQPAPPPKSDAATLFIQANHLYEQSRFADAIVAYSQILSNGFASAPLHFNLANSHLKNNQVGAAIAHYRLAARLAPRDPDIRRNLETARAKVTPPAFSFKRALLDLLTRLSTNEWTALATANLWTLLGLLCIRELRPARFQRLARLTWSVAASFAIVGTATASSWWTQQRTLHAVVVQSGATARFGPFEESPKAFDAREGLEVLVLDRQADWLFVSSGQGLDGWLAATNAWVLTPARPPR